MSTQPLCNYDLPDHFADYQLSDEELEDPVGSCAAHLPASIDWRLTSNKAVLITKAEPIEEEVATPKAAPAPAKQTAEREPAAQKS